jgi:ribosome biogenesis protein BMS1
VKSVQRRAQYALDHETKREHAKLLPHKETEESAPPIIVAVQGPPGVGKTTLISSLVKHYTRFNVTSIKGPITLVGFFF